MKKVEISLRLSQSRRSLALGILCMLLAGLLLTAQIGPSLQASLAGGSHSKALMTSQASASVLASGPPFVNPSVVINSPDDATLYISDSAANAIFRLPATGGVPALIASGDALAAMGGMTISPDGSTLYIAGFARGQILSLPVTGGTPTILASGSPLVNPLGVAISPDGSTLYIADNYGPIFRLPATGGTLTRLDNGPLLNGATDIIVSLDGSSLFIAALGSIWRLPAAGGTPTALPINPSINHPDSITLSADGNTLYIRDTPYRIYSLPVSGGTPTQLWIGLPLYYSGAIRTSHDGKVLYVGEFGNNGPSEPPDLDRVIVINLPCDAVEVTTQPISQMVCAGNNVTFTAAASGNPAPTVQWQVSTDGGAVFRDLSGATNMTLSFAAALAQNGNQYRAVFKGTCNVATAAATLNVGPPIITTFPVSQTVCAGNLVRLSVAALGGGLSYQWRKNGAPLSDGGSTFGTNTPVLTIGSAVTSDAATYDALVSNLCGSVATNRVTLTVYTPPTITTQPTNQTACAGDNVTFTTVVDGSPTPTLQWQLSTNGGYDFYDLVGATSTSLSFAANAGQNGTLYRAVVTNGCNTVVAGPVSLMINLASCSSPPVATITAIANTRQQGSPATTSNIATVSDTKQSAGSLVVTFSDGSTSKTVNGVTVASLTNTSGTISASIATACTATTASFTLKVTDNLGATATANLVVNVSANAIPAVQASASVLASGPPFANPSGVVNSPDDATLYISDSPANAIFRLPAIGGVPALIASSDAFVSIGGMDISPNGSTLFITDFARGRVLSLPVTGGMPTILASGAPLVNPGGIAISPDGSTLYIADNRGPIFSMPAAGGTLTRIDTGPLLNGATDIIVSRDGTSLFIAALGGIWRLPAAGGTPTALLFNPSINHPDHITLSADGNTLYIRDTPYTIDSLPVSGGTPTRLWIGAPLFYDGAIRASHDGKVLFVGEFGLNGPSEPPDLDRVIVINLPCDAVNITTQPISQTVCAGNNVTFTAAASGNPAPTVQWQVSTDGGAVFRDLSGAVNTTLNFADLCGATNTTTTLSFAATLAQNGNQYRAVFKGTCNVATAAATLNVGPPIITTFPVSQTVCAGNLVRLSVAALGGGLSYQWRKNGAPLSDGGSTFGANTPVLTIGSTANDAATYDALVSNLCGSVATNRVTLTVYTPPTIINQPTNQTVCAGDNATFTTVISGNPTPTLQWQLSTNGGHDFYDIVGATSASLSFVANAGQDGTLYRAVVTNGCNTVVAGPVSLTINSAACSVATITAIANTRQQGSPATTSNIATVSDTKQSAGSLVVTFSDGSTSKTVNGVTVASLTNTSGTISASIAAACTATTASFPLKVTDNLGATATSNLTVNVSANAIPAVTITGPVSGVVSPLGTTVNFTGSFTDNAGTHTANWNFDSITQAGVVNESTGAVNASYTFTAAGVYLVTLSVTDNCGATGTANTVDGLTAMVVIYDPNGGWVVGHGWINSPAGAYHPSPALTGKASFGFVSKYQPGATAPAGNTEFQFQQAGFSFHGASYEWLVVAGARAQYKGTGTVNGSGNYGFMLTAIDGQINGGGGVDKFRIKIWDKNNGDAIVYDNQMGASDDSDPTTVLGGGSIVIHK